MTTRRLLLGLAAATLLAVPAALGQTATATCYNCPPQWADWASMLKAIQQDLGIAVPHDNKNSGQSLSQLLAERALAEREATRERIFEHPGPATPVSCL